MSDPMECRACDGTGWVEGGTAIRTPCTRCGGLGILSDLVHRVPASPPATGKMTQAEAVAEAERRWGATAWAEVVLGGDYPDHGRVPDNASVGVGDEEKGSGDSWEAAFADADSRVPASPRETTEPPPIYGKQLRAESPAPAGLDFAAAYEAAFGWPMTNDLLPEDARYHANLDFQHRALVDAAVANAIRTHEAMAVQVCADAVKATRAEYTPLLQCWREWVESRTAPRFSDGAWLLRKNNAEKALMALQIPKDEIQHPDRLPPPTTPPIPKEFA